MLCRVDLLRFKFVAHILALAHASIDRATAEWGEGVVENALGGKEGVLATFEVGLDALQIAENKTNCGRMRVSVQDAT